MLKLATGSSIDRGWQIVRMLEEATKHWPPPNEFVLVLRKDKVEVWSWSPQRRTEVEFIKEVVRDYVEGK